MTNLAPDPFYRRNLPHVQPPGATFFVTFRLADSIPATVLAELNAQARARQSVLEQEPDSARRAESSYRLHRWFFGQWDQALDMGAGPNWLRQPAVAELVAEAMHHFDGKRYQLLAYCIMSNHVHLVFTPLLKNAEVYYPVAQIMHTMKGYSARQANHVLGQSGPFWMHESYDHFVRSTPELERIIAYVLNNPVKAGLVPDWRDWPWSYVAASCAPQFGGP